MFYNHCYDDLLKYMAYIERPIKQGKILEVKIYVITCLINYIKTFNISAAYFDHQTHEDSRSICKHLIDIILSNTSFAMETKVVQCIIVLAQNKFENVRSVFDCIPAGLLNHEH